MTTIGLYLELNLENTTPSNLTNEEYLDASVRDLKNWTLKDGFYDHYPQWRGLCTADDAGDFEQSQLETVHT